MRSVLKTSILLLAGGWFVTAYANDAVDADNLYIIYQLAVENDPQMRAARAELRSQQEVRNISRGNLLPQLRLNAGVGRTDTTTETETDDPLSSTLASSESDSTTASANLSLSQQVFNLNAWYNFKSGSLTSEQAELEFIKQQQELLHRTANAYFHVLRAQNNLSSSVAEEKAMQQQLDQMQQRFDVGLVAVTDVNEARAAFDMAKVNRINNEGNLQIAYEGLSLLTGSRHTQLLPLSENFPIDSPEPADMNQWVEIALANNPELKAAQKSVQTAEYKAKASRASHLPVVSLNASYAESRSEGDRTTLSESGGVITNVTRDFESDTDSKSISLNLTMPLYSGGTISAQRRQAYAQHDMAREKLMGAERQITQQTRSQYIAVMTNMQRVSANRQAIVSTRSALDAIQAGYDVGTRNIVDVLDAQRNLIAAERDYGNARYEYVISLLKLKQLAGNLTPDDLTILNEWIVADSDQK